MSCSPAWQSGRRLKPGASGLRSEVGCAKPKLRSLESLPSFCTECGSKAPNSTGHQRRSLISLRSRSTEFPPTSGSERPCRDAGVGEIALGFAMLERAKRASHIDPPASSYAIMRRARPYRGENPAPGKDAHGGLTPRPELENSQDPERTRRRTRQDTFLSAKPAKELRIAYARSPVFWSPSRLDLDII